MQLSAKIFLGNFGKGKTNFEYFEKAKTESSKRVGSSNRRNWLQLTSGIAAGWDLKNVRLVKCLLKKRYFLLIAKAN